MSARRLTLVIGPTEKASARLRGIGRDKAGSLEKMGIWMPEWNHVRLYAACADPQEIGVLRYKRGMDNPLVQQTLTHEFRTLLERDLEENTAPHVVFCAAQLGSLLSQKSELDRLLALFEPHFDRIDIAAYVDEQARRLTRHYIYSIMEGRRQDLSPELELARCLY